MDAWSWVGTISTATRIIDKLQQRVIIKDIWIELIHVGTFQHEVAAWFDLYFELENPTSRPAKIAYVVEVYEPPSRIYEKGVLYMMKIPHSGKYIKFEGRGRFNPITIVTDFDTAISVHDDEGRLQAAYIPLNSRITIRVYSTTHRGCSKKTTILKLLEDWAYRYYGKTLREVAEVKGVLTDKLREGNTDIMNMDVLDKKLGVELLKISSLRAFRRVVKLIRHKV